MSDLALPDAVRMILGWWTPQVREVLGPDLYSIALYGSVTLGDFAPGWSDVDTCIVLSEPISEEEADRLAALHDATRERFVERHENGWRSGQAVEGQCIPRELVADPEAAAPCYKSWGHERKRIDGNPITGFDRYMLAHHGVCWSGEAVSFTPPTRDDLRRQLHKDLGDVSDEREWHARSPLWLAAITHWFARSSVFWRDGEMLSKTAALEREISNGSPFAVEYELALRLRREGSVHCGEHHSELRANFNRIIDTVLKQLREWSDK